MVVFGICYQEDQGEVVDLSFLEEGEVEAVHLLEAEAEEEAHNQVVEEEEVALHPEEVVVQGLHCQE